MKKVKVAFFAEILIEDFDGATRTMFQLLQRIPSQQFELLFICGEGPDELFGFTCLKIPAITLPLNTTYKMALPQLAAGTLKAALRHFNPDVVHIATPSLLGQFALSYARRYNLPVMSVYHTNFVSYIAYYLKYLPALVPFIENKVLENQRNFYNGCHMVYVPSVTMFNSLVQSGVERHRMKIWKRGIDRSLFTPTKRDEGWMRSITGNNKPVILFASRLVWEKNLETLVQVYEGLQQKQLPYHLVIAGDGVAKAACEQRMPHATFLGKVSHQVLSRLYASADVFLFPSVSETIGNVVLEAMSSGLPCVVADGGGSRDFIEHGVNGFKCAPGNAADYINRVHTLLTNQPLRRQFIAAGLQHSRQYNWNNLAAIYCNDVWAMARSAVKNRQQIAELV